MRATMRVAAPDVILFVVGLVLFAGAGYALVQQEGSGVLGSGGSPTGVYTVTFPLETVEVDEASVANFASANAEFQVNATNVKRVLVTIDCNDPLPGTTYNLRVEVEGPNVTAEPAFGRCNEAFEVEVPVADAPVSAATEGGTEEEARANLPPSENATKAQGLWTVTVTGSRGGTPLPGLPQGQPSGAVVLSVERWEPELSPVTR